MENHHRLDSNPFDQLEAHRNAASGLEESIAYPLPFPQPQPPSAYDHHQEWFGRKGQTDSPSTGSPSPRTAYDYHPSWATIGAHPAAPSHESSLPSSDGTSMRTVEVTHEVPHFSSVESHGLGSEESATVGYQMPSNWRTAGRGYALYDPPMPRKSSIAVS